MTAHSLSIRASLRFSSRRCAVIGLIATALAVTSQAQAQPQGRRQFVPPPSNAAVAPPAKPAEPPKTPAKDDAPIVTHHEIKVGGKTLKYTVTTGKLPLNNRAGEPEAHVFSMAYTLDDAGPASKRPLMFSFNGGPGSSSVWLHLGALGPKRVPMPDDASYPKPPYALTVNEATWLDKTDLVFIDPVGTGFSRAAKPELNAKFHGLQGDIASVGDFIRLYITRNDRWKSPLYLVGESYGTTRAAGLSENLFERGIALNGIILVSTVIDFQTLSFSPGNDLAYILILPSYTATAWYHKKLAPELQADLKKTLAEAEKFADVEYRAALAKGDLLTADERAAVVSKIARYTGLSTEFIDRRDLRVSESAFGKELLIKQRRSVGRIDSRYVGIDLSAESRGSDFDPSLAASGPAYTSCFNTYVRDELNYKSDVNYHILGSEEIGRWDWGQGGMGYPQTYLPLREAMAKNPHMKILVASGYFDLATPYFATDYTFAHMNLDPSVRKNISTRYYDAGHMMYVHTPSLMKLKSDAAAFIDATSGK